MSTIRVALPAHLRALAGVGAEISLEVPDPPTADRLLDILEADHPMLRGTIREHGTRRRRAYIRYFAGGRDISFEPTDVPLPAGVIAGEDVFRVVGAISGG